VSLVNKILQLLASLCFYVVCASAAAAPLAVGDAVPVFSAKDQFGKELNSTNGVRFLLVATEMAAAKSANQKLAAQGAGFLEHNAAVYMLDIHTMPGIARYFAFPKMRKYPQRIGLVDSASTLAAFPAQRGCVTVVAVDATGRIRRLAYWDPTRDPVMEFLK